MKQITAAIILGAALALGACSSKEGPSHTEAMLAELNVPDGRVLKIDGAKNLRDLGGYAAADGRTVKWGMIYRSANLHELSKKGQAELAGLGVRAVTDLRSDPEREQEPDKLPKTEPAIQYAVLPVNDEPVDIDKLARKIVKGDVKEEEVMLLLDHRRFITDSKHRATWGEWVRSLADEDTTPHLFHCTSGKDRAGYGAAITLLTLGVPKETVKQDFLLSNAVYADYIDETVGKIDRFAGKDANTDLIRKIMGVSPETIDATFAQMEADYGSIDAFIAEGLGIDTETRKVLQDKFLEN